MPNRCYKGDWRPAPCCFPWRRWLWLGLLGRNILENFEISVPVLALTGGLILFLVALRTVLEQSIPEARLKQDSISPGTDPSLSPLAFPIIVTPYGIAAVIVFAT